MLAWNLAEEYAQQFNLPSQGPNETGAVFRMRVASHLAAMGESILAHEALHNHHESSNPFAAGELNDGYGHGYVMAVAKHVEESFQYAEQRRIQQRTRQQWTKKLAFWQRSR